MGTVKKKHPQGVEQFADSTNTQADATPHQDYITLDGQMSLFDSPKLRITKPVRLIELFSGIGSQAKALQRLGVPYESWGAYDIDKYAVAAYNAIHGTDYVPTDITKMTADDLNIVDTEHYTYLLTYSFPCQDLSLAGLGKGMSKGSGTRSGLLWEVERLLHECKELPQILVMENVKQVISKKNKKDFDLWRESLRGLGYESAYQVMNAKDYGVAQNRERCFMVSWLGDYSYTFPEAIPLAKKLRDYLVSDVDNKYFLTDEQVSSFVSRTELNNDANEWANVSALAMGRVTKWHQRGDVYPNDGSAGTLTATMYKAPPSVGWGADGNKTKTSGMRISTNNKRGYEEAEDGDFINLQYASSSTRRGRVGKQVAQTICCTDEQAVVGKMRIRKLTPIECWRLMNFDDEDFYKAQAIESNTQLYAQAGNSIVVNCLTAIFGQMFEGKERIYEEQNRTDA